MNGKFEISKKWNGFLQEGFKNKASDLHFIAGSRPVLRIDGCLKELEDKAVDRAELEEFIDEILIGKEALKKELLEKGHIDFSYEKSDLGRLRVNIYRVQGSYGIAMRLLSQQVPTMQQLELPVSVLKGLAEAKKGLILVTGPTGSGKTSTLASLLDYMNETKSEHILTLEDPIEYIHYQKKCLISQREIGLDACSYSEALKAALREDPDVILVGEMRDLETISTAITAAETGHLVLSSLHTTGAAETVDRIVDVFPANQQQYIRLQLAQVLKAVISQQLLPRSDKRGRCIALEIMINNYAIANMIRECRTHQIYSQIQTRASAGMMTMDETIANHYKAGKISEETLYRYAQNREEIKRMISR